MIVFRVLTAPAALLGRIRYDLRASISADEQTFASGPARWFLLVLAAVAVGYPILASIFHVTWPNTIVGDPYELAIRPVFEVVYSESLPFMLAVLAVGTWSPALGVLLMAVFIPADLVAAGQSSPELVHLGWQQYPEPIFARFISYGLLWLLAVEIPLLARSAGVAAAVRSREGRELVVGIATRVVVSAVAVFFWSMALPWLIQPVFTWSGLQQITPMASAATWVFWYILVAGAVVVTAAASVWPRPYAMGLALDPDELKRTERAPSVAREVARSFVVVVVVGVLLAGLMTDLSQAVILIAGLLAAGPILTLLLPRIAVPRRYVEASIALRWLVAITLCLLVGWVVLTVAGDALYADYSPVVVAIAITAPLFRLLLDAGRAGRHASRSPAERATAVGAGVGALMLGGLVWMGAPTSALANNCPDLGELGECLKQASLAGLGMIGAALSLIGVVLFINGAFWGGALKDWLNKTQPDDKTKTPQRPPPPDNPRFRRSSGTRKAPPTSSISGAPPAPPSPPPGDRYPPNADTQNDSYNPGEAGPH